MLNTKGSYLDSNGKKVKTDNLLKDPKLINIIKYGGEIVVPANRPDMIKFFTDMQRVNPKIKVTTTGNIRAKFYKDKVIEDLNYKMTLNTFKKKSADEVERLEKFFNDIFKNEKNSINGLHIFINKIDDEYIDYYDLIIDIIIKNILNELSKNKNLIIVHKKREDNFFETLPDDKEIAKILSSEILLLYKDLKLKNVNCLNYIIQQLPQNFSYRRTHIIIFECFNYFLNLIEEARGEF